MDNPNIGRELAETYWRPGNSRTFLDLVEQLTGEAFSAKATVRLVNTPLEEVFQQAEAARAAESSLAHYNGPVNLNAGIRIVHGDEVIAATNDGLSFEELSERFSQWIRSLEA